MEGTFLDSAGSVVYPDVRAVHPHVLDGFQVRLHLVPAILVMVHALLHVARLHALAEQLRDEALPALVRGELGLSSLLETANAVGRWNEGRVSFRKPLIFFFFSAYPLPAVTSVNAPSRFPP